MGQAKEKIDTNSLYIYKHVQCIKELKVTMLMTVFRQSGRLQNAFCRVSSIQELPLCSALQHSGNGCGICSLKVD